MFSKEYYGGRYGDKEAGDSTVKMRDKQQGDSLKFRAFLNTHRERNREFQTK